MEETGQASFDYLAGAAIAWKDKVLWELAFDSCRARGFALGDLTLEMIKDAIRALGKDIVLSRCVPAVVLKPTRSTNFLVVFQCGRFVGG